MAKKNRINLTGALRRVAGVTIDKDAIAELDIEAICMAIATTAAEQMRENMLAGKAPNGTRATRLDPDTIKRKGNSVRGVRTGRLANSIRAVPTKTGAKVVADEEGPGQLRAALGRKPFRVNMSSPEMREALQKAARLITGDE